MTYHGHADIFPCTSSRDQRKERKKNFSLSRCYQFLNLEFLHRPKKMGALPQIYISQEWANDMMAWMLHFITCGATCEKFSELLISVGRVSTLTRPKIKKMAPHWLLSRSRSTPGKESLTNLKCVVQPILLEPGLINQDSRLPAPF